MNPTNNKLLRIIARLDIKGQNLIKGIHLEGLRVLGLPKTFATRYFHEGLDELILMDSVASLYGRNQLESLVAETAREVFIPITVGGGIRSVDDVKKILRAGADKVAINTAAIASPILISEVAKKFGSQCMVLSIEAKKNDHNSWEAFTDGGRQHSGLDVVDWAKKAVSLGAGEILLTSVDNEGTGKGFDLELIKAVSSAVNVPVIASGGFGDPKDAVNAHSESFADAIAIAGALHYKKISLFQIQEILKSRNIPFRTQRL